MDEMEIKTNKRVELIDISNMVRNVVSKSDVEDGICVISTKHTTSSIIINENEAGLREDILKFLGKLVPKGAGYCHDRIDDNADAHLKAVLLGCSETLPIAAGELVLGTWQSVFFAEFDGPRKRRVEVSILSRK